MTETPNEKAVAYQSPEETEEMLLQELENLFDKPCLVPIENPKEVGTGGNKSS
jgi:hypothetical protein